MESIFKNWGIMRVIRLAIGLYAFYEVIKKPDFLIGAMALILIAMAVFNVGCGAQGCGIPPSRKNDTSTDNEEVSYKEVK
jgi:hypothetical protein